jgi:hypothetical protein
MGIMDVQSAFDVVQHNILLDKLLDKQIHPILWTLIKDMYSGLTTRVEWLGIYLYNIIAEIFRVIG